MSIRVKLYLVWCVVLTALVVVMIVFDLLPMGVQMSLATSALYTIVALPVHWWYRRRPNCTPEDVYYRHRALVYIHCLFPLTILTPVFYWLASNL